MPDIPHVAPSAADSTNITTGQTQYFQIKVPSGGKVRGRFYLHALDTVSNKLKATCWVARGYSESNGTSRTPVVSEAEDANVTVPISCRDWTSTEPSGTAVIADKWKTFTQGQWLSNEHTIRDGATLTLCVKNEDAATVAFFPIWVGS